MSLVTTETKSIITTGSVDISVCGQPLSVTSEGSPVENSLNVHLTNTSGITIAGLVTVAQSGLWSVTANAGTNLNTSLLALDSTLTGGTQKSLVYDGTNTIFTSTHPGYVQFQSAQVVTLASTTITGSVAVTGTFWQTTQPVSLASTTITGTVAVIQSTSPWVVSNSGTFAVQDSAAESSLATIAGAIGSEGSPAESRMKISVRTSMTNPPAAADGADVAPMADHLGRYVTIQDAPPELQGMASLQTTDNSSHTLVAAQGLGVFAYITYLFIGNETTTAAVVSLSDGTNTYKFPIAGVVGSGGPITPPGGFKPTSSNTNWTVQASASATLDFTAKFVNLK